MNNLKFSGKKQFLPFVKRRIIINLKIMENIKSDQSVIVREAFILPVFKVILSQFFLGNIFFLLVTFYEIESVMASMILFNALEGSQILLSVAIFLAWYHRSYEISTNEIEIKSGLILQKTASYSLNHLESVTFRKTMGGIFFNYGNVKVSLHYGTDSKVIHINNVKEPVKYAKLLNQKLKKHTR